MDRAGDRDRSYDNIRVEGKKVNMGKLSMISEIHLGYYYNFVRLGVYRYAQSVGTGREICKDCCVLSICLV